MSRAFTREQDDDRSPSDIGERPISDHRNLVTAEGLASIEEQVAALHEELARAEAEGDREKIALVSRDLRYWSARRQSMQVITTSATPVAISFGTTVELKRGGKTLRLKIVGEDEADPAVGLIAWTSPLAQALDGAEAGELIEFEAGGRVEMIEVVSVAAR